MQSFIEEVVQELVNTNEDFSKITFVLPSKRAGTFLKNNIAKNLNKTIFSPTIYSIESFVEKIAELTYASSTEQLFTLYDSYIATTKENDKDNFLSFSKWGQTILQDFNEIDRYLIDTDKIFNHLSAVQEMNTYMQEEKTKMIEDYIKFWDNLDSLYNHFNESLRKIDKGTQGYVYRIANERLQEYLENNSDKKIVFIGFNALNKAEEEIIQAILKKPTASIYWDLDTYFLEDSIHDASYFIRQHQKNWPYLNENPLKGISNNYLNTKNIQIIGVPKNVSQANYVGSILKQIHSKTPDLLKQTAVVLGDENLLNPIMNAIPEEISRINITMGYPIGKTTLAGTFNLFFDLWLSKDVNGWFYQHVLNILSNPYVQTLLGSDDENIATKIADTIKTKNWSYVQSNQIYAIAPEQKEMLQFLFSDEKYSNENFLDNCLGVIQTLKTKYQEAENNLELEYLFRFHTLFNQIKVLIKEHSFITDIKSLQGLYREVLSTETLDFQGEPLQGTQIMGMLESRNLDFETIIITSVNEGILPSGKSNNSFIPFDVKIAYGLPTYKEKDAVYTYHFYRLLQRAKNVYIIYNTEPNALDGNEKSRLISQLLTDENRIKDITEITASANVKSTINELTVVHKDEKLLEAIKVLAEKGFSPTSLTNYIRNPIDFYKRSILKINDTNEVEESVAANTFGTIVHDSLEDLYQPFINKFLEKEALEALHDKIEGVVKNNFVKTYADGTITQGKNLIAYNVIIRYIENFIKLEIKELAHNKIKIIALEQGMEANLSIPGITSPVKVRGKLDRIDEINGVTRIVDYKTGKVEARHVKITSFEELIETYDKSKAFQLLCYALLYDTKKPIENVQAGIVSFKNLNAGILKFVHDTDTINQNTLLEYKSVLYKLIQEIFNPEVPFTEKEV